MSDLIKDGPTYVLASRNSHVDASFVCRSGMLAVRVKGEEETFKVGDGDGEAHYLTMWVAPGTARTSAELAGSTMKNRGLFPKNTILCTLAVLDAKLNVLATVPAGGCWGEGHPFTDPQVLKSGGGVVWESRSLREQPVFSYTEVERFVKLTVLCGVSVRLPLAGSNRLVLCR